MLIITFRGNMPGGNLRGSFASEFEDLFLAT